MAIHIDATYRAGAIHPDQPLQLPENTPVHILIVPKTTDVPAGPEEVEAIRPKPPSFTAAELDELLAKHSVSVGSLPADFSRADIYHDHD